jgi:hypothetical protein
MWLTVPVLLSPLRISGVPEDMEPEECKCDDESLAEASTAHDDDPDLGRAGSGIMERMAEEYAVRGAGYCFGGAGPLTVMGCISGTDIVPFIFRFFDSDGLALASL